MKNIVIDHWGSILGRILCIGGLVISQGSFNNSITHILNIQYCYDFAFGHSTSVQIKSFTYFLLDNKNGI